MHTTNPITYQTKVQPEVGLACSWWTSTNYIPLIDYLLGQKRSWSNQTIFNHLKTFGSRFFSVCFLFYIKRCTCAVQKVTGSPLCVSEAGLARSLSRAWSWPRTWITWGPLDHSALQDGYCWWPLIGDRGSRCMTYSLAITELFSQDRPENGPLMFLFNIVEININKESIFFGKL